jgi:hypothetical protein
MQPIKLQDFRPDSTEAYTEFWDPLPYTAKEAADIASSLKKFGYATKNISDTTLPKHFTN